MFTSKKRCKDTKKNYTNQKKYKKCIVQIKNVYYEHTKMVYTVLQILKKNVEIIKMNN